MKKTGKLNTLIVATVLAALFASILLTNAPASQAGPAAVAMPPQQIDVVARPQQHQPISYSGPHVESVREQLDPHASDRYLVWTERERSLKPEVNDLRDTTTLTAYDLWMNKQVALPAARRTQAEPAISGSMVAWMDAQCATCEANIMAEDLATGKRFAVAATPQDESHPAVGGHNVAWLQPDGQHIVLVVRNLDNGPVVKIASLASTSNLTFNNPVASEEYLVWSEISLSGGQPTTAVLRAYSFATGKLIVVASGIEATTRYVVTDHQVLWSNNNIYLTDLVSSKTEVLATREALSLSAQDGTVVWSELNAVTGKTDIWGLNLTNRKILPLVSDSDSKSNPVVAGDRLVWSYQGGQHGSTVASTSLSQAVATASVRQKAMDPQAQQSSVLSAATWVSTRTTNGYPWYKGIFAPLSGPDNHRNIMPTETVPSWKEWGSAGDNAVAQSLFNDSTNNKPMFGTIEILSDVLNYTTQYPSLPTVKDVAMKYQDEHAKVIIRLPTHKPGKAHFLSSSVGPLPYEDTIIGDGSSPFDVVVDIKNLLHQHGWIRDLIIDNEPSDEWPSNCNADNGCAWCGAHKTYYWTGFTDYRMYYAINDFYTEVKDLLKLDQDPVLSQVTFWPPAMNPDWPINRVLFGLLDRMVSTYGLVSYNLYPYPARDAKDRSVDVLPTPTGTVTGIMLGHLRNRTYDLDFTPEQQAKLDSRTIRSQITEFGWQPGSIAICYGQDETWLAVPLPPLPPQTCSSKDVLSHRFEEDVNYLLTSDQLHGAESVNVWIMRGWNRYADGINQEGTPTTWFSLYRNRYQTP